MPSFALSRTIAVEIRNFDDPFVSAYISNRRSGRLFYLPPDKAETNKTKGGVKCEQIHLHLIFNRLLCNLFRQLLPSVLGICLCCICPFYTCRIFISNSLVKSCFSMYLVDVFSMFEVGRQDRWGKRIKVYLCARL
ncbi:unnamed protein product [Victoria cruziana]